MWESVAISVRKCVKLCVKVRRDVGESVLRFPTPRSVGRDVEECMG